MTASLPAFIEARPINGYLVHAVPANQPSDFHRTAPRILITYRRALCGVGRGGMRVRLDPDTFDPRRWVGVDGCDRCHVAYNKITKEAAA